MHSGYVDLHTRAVFVDMSVYPGNSGPSGHEPGPRFVPSEKACGHASERTGYVYSRLSRTRGSYLPRGGNRPSDARGAFVYAGRNGASAHQSGHMHETGCFEQNVMLGRSWCWNCFDSSMDVS